MPRLKKISELEELNINNFSKELLDAVTYMSIYETKIKDLRLEGYIYLPKLNMIEALSSMQIEGTRTTMEDVISSEVIPDTKNPDIKEVNNHNIALTKGAKMVKIDGFTNDNIKQMHSILLDGIRNKNKNATIGCYKTKNNCIKNKAGAIVYNAPTVEETQEYMDELIDFMNNGAIKYHPLINAAIMHAQFESIHPFDDGNGRLGRLLIPIYLYSKEMINAPLFYISEAIGKDKYKYYKTLQETRDGDYNEWIRYFLEKCTIQAKKHIEYIESIDKLYDETEKIIEKNINSGNSLELLKAIFEYPIITSAKLAEKIKISTSQASRYLQKLEEVKVVYTDGKKRNTTYYFGELLTLII